MVGLTRRTFSVLRLGAFAASTPVLAAGASPVATGARVPAPVGVLTRLPGDGNQLALTVDDGCSTADVAALGRFCADTGMRLTFFVNGINPSWTVNAPLLQPMVSSGQIQLGNHTWSHADITRISPAALAEQIGRTPTSCEHHGVDGGRHLVRLAGTTRTPHIAADHGYPTITLWSAAIGDSRPIDDAA